MEKPKWTYYHKERWDRLVLHYNFLKKLEDGDDYHRWCYYNIEHMETELSISLEEYKKQTFPSETVLDIFNF